MCPMNEINRSKALIRKVFRDRAKREDVRPGSAAGLSSWPKQWQDRVREARRIAVYRPLSDELSLEKMMKDPELGPGKLCFPRVTGEKLRFFVADSEDLFENGAFSIEEPVEGCEEVDPGEIDILLIPAVAYGKDGTRIGRGKGFYDRFVHHIFENCGTIEGKYLIGVIPECRILGTIPSDPWDVKVDAILTEERFIETPCVCAKRGWTFRHT